MAQIYIHFTVFNKTFFKYKKTGIDYQRIVEFSSYNYYIVHSSSIVIQIY